LKALNKRDMTTVKYVEHKEKYGRVLRHCIITRGNVIEAKLEIRLLRGWWIFKKYIWVGMDKYSFEFQILKPAKDSKDNKWPTPRVFTNNWGNTIELWDEDKLDLPKRLNEIAEEVYEAFAIQDELEDKTKEIIKEI